MNKIFTEKTTRVSLNTISCSIPLYLIKDINSFLEKVECDFYEETEENLILHKIIRIDEKNINNQGNG